MNHPDPEVLKTQERLTSYQAYFGELFASYFRALPGTLDTPSLSRFTLRCLDLVEELSLRGGKRQRVAFMYEAARLTGGSPVGQAADIAALSIELLQTHLLIHDDIIDDSARRRGGPSTYYAYRAELRQHPRHALGLAMLAGDLAAYLALDVITGSGLPADLARAMTAVQARAGLATFVGQVFDLERDFLGVPTEVLLHQVSDYKAARSSALAPLELGLLSSGADPVPHARTLARYAWAFGVSGQMRDDYLSLYGDEAVTGKPATADVRTGRCTYALRHLMRVARDRDRRYLAKVVGKADATDLDVARVREIAVACGADQSLRRDMRRYAEMASEEAATWRVHWAAEPVAFFERVPVWGVERSL
ncbi:polyprenyl synthetase family protein [Streptomyces albireticuli]|uniref:polyprenyl synthetase family protein n=1 Tax=Streptomyces albireticuli TaxID=1940 RepID=UPI00367B0210